MSSLTPDNYRYMCDIVLGTDEAWYDTFGIIALAAMVLLLVLYGLKMIFYPRKVMAEWDCPGALEYEYS